MLLSEGRREYGIEICSRHQYNAFKMPGIEGILNPIGQIQGKCNE